MPTLNITHTLQFEIAASAEDQKASTFNRGFADQIGSNFKKNSRMHCAQREYETIGPRSNPGDSPMKSSPRPRILLLVPDKAGGIRSLFEHLGGQHNDDAQMDFEYFTSVDEQPNNVLRFPMRLFVFLNVLRQGQFSLCHINLSTRGSTLRKIIYSWICRWVGLPYVIHLHGGHYPTFYSGLSRILQFIVRNFFHHASRVIVLGTFWRDYVIDDLNVVPDCVSILPNAVAGPEQVPTQAARARAPAFLFLGRLGTNKGVPELLKALASPTLMSLKWTAVLAGDGDVDLYQTEAHKLGLDQRVRFPGWVSAGEVRNLLAASDILVLPSHAENLPLSMLEGMAYGLCPVVTPVGAIPDVIAHDVNGILIKVGDAKNMSNVLEGLLADQDKLDRLRLRSRKDFLEFYDIKQYRSRLEAVYFDTLGKP